MYRGTIQFDQPLTIRSDSGTGKRNDPQWIRDWKRMWREKNRERLRDYNREYMRAYRKKAG